MGDSISRQSQDNNTTVCRRIHVHSFWIQSHLTIAAVTRRMVTKIGPKKHADVTNRLSSTVYVEKVSGTAALRRKIRRKKK